MSSATLPMHLFNMQVQAATGPERRGVSVWVEATDVGQARTLAAARLAEAGWNILSIDSEALTDAEDYFRPCPSQQAFVRAQTETVAWRFDDE